MVPFSTKMQDCFLFPEELEELAEEASQIKFNHSPSFLGSFEYSAFGEDYGKGRFLPSLHRRAAMRMLAYFNELGYPEQRYNVAFVQRYKPGKHVKEHRDPFNNKGMTMSLSYGDFDKAILCLDGQEIELYPGTLAIFRTTVKEGDKEVRGPLHSVKHDFVQGMRYALILNTIVAQRKVDTITPSR